MNATQLPTLIENEILPQILFITSFPPRECGIATYSQDLIKALHNKFSRSFTIAVCALESENEKHNYNSADNVMYILNTQHAHSFIQLANNVNANDAITLVVVQHEFGFFEKREPEFLQLLAAISKPVIVVFHTVLPKPNKQLTLHVQQITALAQSVIVMTHTSEEILLKDYSIIAKKITVIPHGTHLVPHADKDLLKQQYHLAGKKILSTFGLLSSGKSIETTLHALPAIVKTHPNVLFLIIGKTHPSVVKQEGEKYRNLLQAKVVELKLEANVRFINQFLPLPELLEYLQLTDIYLFTSKNPNQAVSGTFSYAISSGCPIVSTPIPHAREVLGTDAGIIVDFENPKQLAKAVISLLDDAQLCKSISSNGLHRMASTAWENAAIAHALLFEKMDNATQLLRYNLPNINLNHVKKLTTHFGMIQFATINYPDIDTGYTLDDNARAMVAMCQHFELTGDASDIMYIDIYLDFIKYCLQHNGDFLNYVDEKGAFTQQNYETNLADSNGRAIWALGYLISMGDLLPQKLTNNAQAVLHCTLQNVKEMHSTRAMAFVIKGLYYSNTQCPSVQNVLLIKDLANRLVQMYRHEAEKGWLWYESYLTYANSILPEAMLCAWLATEDVVYQKIAQTSFNFLLDKIFGGNSIKVISNKGWLHKGKELMPKAIGGEQPIDVAYTILALQKFYQVFKTESYLQKIEIAFNWFLGDNHLHQIIYNPCTGGCYDGLEINYVNLNQGAESTVSYLMARLTIEKKIRQDNQSLVTKKMAYKTDKVAQFAVLCD